ncbi:ABC-F family ATP-binding cassette domain-containing protein [Iodidimonas sp. SYSU 1G8]|uniref:ABC-F family ATP-binding cassette domain-containing protein n=1 Tax=Iodidimonas sp. SYSU 1G8 TaxID=3133967 RepID=UPI0031FE477C
MLAIRNITFTMAGNRLFDNASAVIPTGHKVGMVGRNGTGKTTLFRLIRGELSLDDGEIEVPRAFRIGGVAQEAPATDHTLLETVLMADIERAALLDEAETATEPNRIAEIQIRLADIDAYSAESRAATILSGLGFDAEAQQRPCHEFSGGWRMRVALGAVLFSQPDLLLLDEPTNYLDLEGTVWLESFIAKYPHTALIISHDRELLNRSVDGILHLTGEKLTYYTGTYDQFDNERRLKLEQQISMKRKQDAQRAHIQSFVDRFKAKASKARQAQSRVKMLERMKPIAAVSENAVAPFHFPAPDELAPPLVTFENASVGYDGNTILRNLNLRLDQDDRIALLGSNGEGKSTFAKLLAGRLPLMTGKITKSSKLRIGFFAQHQLDELVEGENSLQHLMRKLPNEGQAQLRARLGAAGIGADIVLNPVEKLSGGQKARLLMALAALEAPHIMILDEPTNHLDIESREVLVHALNEYPGAVILVSHDPHLVETVADQLWLVKDGKVAPFDGDMEDYKRLLLSQRGPKKEPGANRKGENKPSPPVQAAAPAPSKAQRANAAPLRNKVRDHEKQIAKLEADLARAEATLADPKLYASGDKARIERLTRAVADIKASLAREEEAWIAAQDALEQALTA